MPQHSYSTFTFEARAPRSNRKKTIEVFVSAGAFQTPYYTFTDKKGREIEAFEIDPSKNTVSEDLARHQHIHFTSVTEDGIKKQQKKSKSKEMEITTTESSGQRNSPCLSKRSIRGHLQPLPACFSSAQAIHRWQTSSSLMQAKGHCDNAFQPHHSRRQSSQ